MALVLVLVVVLDWGGGDGLVGRMVRREGGREGWREGGMEVWVGGREGGTCGLD